MTVLESLVEYHEMTVMAKDCKIPDCYVHPKKESDTVTDKRVFIDENELTLMIQATVDGTIKESVRQRDLLWCKALTACGLDPREMHKVLAKFNRLRPDKEQKAPGESDPRLLEEETPPTGGEES